MVKVEEIIEYSKNKVREFGASEDPNLASFVFRNNTGADALAQGGAYFGFIAPDEEPSGAYHDLSLVIFPSESSSDSWLISLGIGTLGFKSDYELVSQPGIRRLFSSLIDENGFCKNSFLDIESNLPQAYRIKMPHLRKTLDTYQKLLLANQIIADPGSENGKKMIAGFIAAYARIRNWPGNKTQRSAVDKALLEVVKEKKIDDENKVLNLIKERRFVIIQGAPGTGKTRLAKKIPTMLNAKQFFTQFHAQTDYSDFIYGIMPELNQKDISYVSQKGVFYESLKYAEEHPSEKVVLIIDEINRANLSNILGPIFYLFEYKQEDASAKIKIGGDYFVTKIPPNYYVVATMNTADRSLAVVDFALRRRFAWYTLKPKQLKIARFHEDDFNSFAQIFNMYASSEELNLQPGQAYFLADSEEEMNNRIRYELMPLIKEYLMEGLLQKAKDEFSNYFYRRIGEVMFE